MVSLYFARHGQTDWNRAGKTQGENDIPLNAEGFAQAQSLASILLPLPIQQVICSSLQRARATAELATENFNWPIISHQHWREFSLMAQRQGNRDELDRRLNKQLQSLLQQNKSTLLVSHGAVFESLCRSLNMPLKQLANAAVVEIFAQTDKPRRWCYRTIFSGYD